MKGTIFVADKIVAEADLVAQIVKKPKVRSWSLRWPQFILMQGSVTML
jgi:hypothetical protein